MERRGILFIVSGPSGVGKGTIREKLMENESGFAYSISVTTRKPRDGEVDGRDYFFVSAAQFETMIQKDELLEWAQVYNHYYGTPKDFVANMLENGQDVLLEIDMQGAMKVKRSFPSGVFVFIRPPDLEALGQRLRSRGKDSEDEIQKRLAQFEEEMRFLDDYDYVIINDDLPTAVNALKSIITAERLRVSRQN